MCFVLSLRKLIFSLVFLFQSYCLLLICLQEVSLTNTSHMETQKETLTEGRLAVGFDVTARV